MQDFRPFYTINILSNAYWDYVAAVLASPSTDKSNFFTIF